MLMECFLIVPSRASVVPERKLGQKGVECRSLCAGEEVLQNSSNLVMHQMIYRIDNAAGNAWDLIGAARATPLFYMKTFPITSKRKTVISGCIVSSFLNQKPR